MFWTHGQEGGAPLPGPAWFVGCLCGRTRLGSGLALPKAHRSGLHPLMSFLGAEPTSGQAGCQRQARQGWSLWGVAGAEGG